MSSFPWCKEPSMSGGGDHRAVRPPTDPRRSKCESRQRVYLEKEVQTGICRCRARKDGGRFVMFPLTSITALRSTSQPGETPSELSRSRERIERSKDMGVPAEGSMKRYGHSGCE